MKKIIAAFSLALFSSFPFPLSSLPSDGGYRALEAEEAGIIDLENQASNSVEMAEMPTAIIVVDNAWIEANKDLFDRAMHLNIDDECAITMEKFRKLKPEAGCLIVTQVKAGEDPQYFWYSGESIKEWLRESSIDPQSRLPVKLVKYFNLNSLEVGKELSLVEDEVKGRSSLMPQESNLPQLMRRASEETMCDRVLMGATIGLIVVSLGLAIGAVIVWVLDGPSVDLVLLEIFSLVVMASAAVPSVTSFFRQRRYV